LARRAAFSGARKGRRMALMPNADLMRFFNVVIPSMVLRLGLRKRINFMVQPP
jgi:hypothetical protein